MINVRQFTNLLPQPVRFGLRRRLFAGSNQTCPLCENSVKAFHGHGGGHAVLDERKVVGGMRREADRCPICHACDRVRMMMLYIESHTAVGQQRTRILHVAPDYGLYLWLKRQPAIDYICTDIDAQRYRHMAELQTADLTKLPFPEDDFDLVICSHVLEHVPDDAAAFSEIARVLKPGGQALLLTPYAMDGKPTDEEPTISDTVEMERRFGQADHVRLYNRDDFLARMATAGLGSRLFEPFSEMPDRAEELSLNPLEALPIGMKASGAASRH
ncbi:MAG: class I SAM-dependent methyltransferase [Pseudomonadota bacterium]